MNETFAIEFDGKAFDNHEIPAALAQSLLALDGLTKRAAEAVYGKEVEAEVRVKAGFKQGSFILDLIAACDNDPVTKTSSVSANLPMEKKSILNLTKPNLSNLR